MGVTIEPSPDDSPRQILCRVSCDLCRQFNITTTIDGSNPELTDPTVVLHLQRDARRQGWHWEGEGSALTIACPACQGQRYRPESLNPIRHLIHENPRAAADSLVQPIQNAVQALANGRAVPAADDLVHLGHRALSRSHPYEPPGLREAYNDLARLVRAPRGLERPPEASNEPFTRFGLRGFRDLPMPRIVPDASVPPGTVFVTSSPEHVGRFQSHQPDATFLDRGIQPGDTIIANPGTAEEFRQQYQGHIPEIPVADRPPQNPSPGDLYLDVTTDEIRVFRDGTWVSIGPPMSTQDTPERTFHETASPPPTPTVGDTYFDTERNELRTYTGAGWVSFGSAPSMETVQVPPATPLTTRPLTGFQRIQAPTARGERARVSESQVIDRQGRRHVVGPFEVDLPDTPGPHRIGVDLGQGDSMTAAILVDGRVIGTTTLRKAHTKFEKIPPKSSWQRLMEDDDDECL